LLMALRFAEVRWGSTRAAIGLMCWRSDRADADHLPARMSLMIRAAPVSCADALGYSPPPRPCRLW